MEERQPVKRGKGIKRGVSMLIAAALTLTVTAGAFSGARALRASQIDYAPAQMGAKVLSAQAAANDSFLSAYVLKERDGTSYNVNDQFGRTGYNNLAGGTDPLSRKAKYRHNSNERWYTEFCWNFQEDSAVKQLWNAGELALNFSGNLYSDYHSNFGNHTSKLWDCATVKITEINYRGEKKLLEVSSKMENDQGPQAYSESLRPGWNPDTALKFWAGTQNCGCGSSAVSDCVLYLVDHYAPKVTKVYAASDQAGENRLTADKGVKAGASVYFVLEFNENIRFSDNEPQALKLALDCAWKENDQNVQASVAADLVSLKGNRMVFSLRVPETLDGKATDIYVHSLLGEQTWAGKSGQFPLALVDGNGETFSVTAGMLDNVGGQITDLAGNPVDWTHSQKSLSEKAYLDNVSPALKQVTISGRKIKSASTTKKTQDGGWPEDVDLSAVYAAIGDQLTFEAWYTEKITELNLENVTATLNLVDQNGDPVKVAAKELLNVTGKSAFGVDASSGYVSELVFEPLTLAEGMEWSTEGDEGPIRIVEISGTESAQDIAGNPLGQTAAIPASLQQQYLDVIPPEVTTSMGQDASDPDRYIPLGFDKSGYMFTVPLKVTDVGSGSMGVAGKFSLDLYDEHCYYWYVDTNPGGTWNQGPERAGFPNFRYSFTQLSEKDTSYLHIRVPQGPEGYTSDGFFEKTLTVTAVDNAGNTAERAFPLRHQVDRVPPDVKSSEYTPSVSYQSGTTYNINMSVKISVTDSFNLRNILYYWEDEGTESQQLVTPDGKTGEFQVTRTFTESLENTSQISGTKTLHVQATDAAGNTRNWTKDFSYEVGRGKSIYTVYTGSVNEPQLTPLLWIKHPDAVNINGEAQRVDTVVLLEYYDYVDQKNKYYGCLPYLGEESPSNDRIDILNEFFHDGITPTFGDKWYKYEIKYDGDKLDVDNDTARLTGGLAVDASKVKSFITKHFGTLKVYFLSSPELVTDGAAPYSLVVSQSQGTIDMETMYLATGFDPESTSKGYNVKIEAAKDADGNDVYQKLVDPSAENGTVSSLEDVGFRLKIENLSDTGDAPYGVSLIDFSKANIGYNSYCTVQYTPKIENGFPSVDSYIGSDFPLAAEKEQVLTVPAGSISYRSGGWYRFVFHFTLLDATPWTVCSQPFYIDKTESTTPYLSAYEKSYTPNGDGGKTVEVCSETYAENSQPAQLKVGLAQTPEGWTVNQQLTFQGTYQPDYLSMTDIDTSGHLENALRIRAFSRKDEAGEANAPWAPLTSAIATGSYKASFTPVLAGDTFTSESYAQNQLPLTEGENIVCVQLKSPNGTLKTTELLVQVSVKAPDPITWKETGRTNKETTLKPVLTEQQALEDWIIGMAGELSSGESDTPKAASGYAFKAVTSRMIEFYVYDTTYGNLSLSSTEVTGVDGIEPTIHVDSTKVLESLYRVNLKIKDDSVSKSEVPTITMTFDASDSALILGRDLTDESERVSVEVPICLEESYYPYCKEYVGFDIANLGIFRTGVSNLNEEEGTFNLVVTGAFPFNEAEYDETKTEEENKLSHELTFTVTDKNGNSNDPAIDPATASIEAMNCKPEFYDVYSLNDDGWPETSSTYPVSAVHSFGAGSITMDTSYESFMSRISFETTLPMINRNGTYTLECTDLFGKQYSQELEVNAFGTREVALDVSETNYTNKPVTVTAAVTGEQDSSAKTSITSLTAVDEEGQPLAEGVLGEPKDGCVTSAHLVMPQNGKVTVTATTSYEGSDYQEEETFSWNITNIDTQLEPAVIYYEYNDLPQPEYIEGSTDTVEGEVTAVLSCEEFVTGTNGPLLYTFPAGSKKGDTYTFEYMDQAGNTGTMTAELPVNIREEEAPPEEQQDTAAPNYTVNCYGMRNDQYAYQGNYIYRVGEEDSQETVGALQQEAAVSLNKALASYPAQGYRLIFDVEDDSDVKLLLRAKDGAAPTSYAEDSTAVDGVSAAGTTITVTKNAEFDVYLVDEKSNITPLKGIAVTALDNEAPTVTVTTSETKIGENGVPYQRSYFRVDGNEQIIVTDESLGIQVDVLEEVDDYGMTIYKNVTVYYHDHTTDGNYVFLYKDIYGNAGSVTATATGLDSAKPIFKSVSWYGTTNNKAPGAEGERMVNHDVTAEITINKSIRNVTLYQYDESKEDGIGAELSKNGGVTVSWVGQKATVTYAENAPAIQMEIIAANGAFMTHTLPEVACIDKVAPVVTGDGGTLAENKRSRTYTFTTNENTTLAEGDMTSRTTAAQSHTWTATQSGAVTLHFADEAGNVTDYPITVTGIDGERLALRFNTTNSDTGAVDASGIPALNLKAGGTLYVSSSKKAVLKLEQGAETTVEANTWTKFTLSAASGFHVLKATDNSTGEITYVTLLVNKIDTTPPVISLPSSTLTLTEGATADEMDEQVRDGVTVTDNVDRSPPPTYDVSGVPAKAEKGIYTLTYTARDSAGNQGTATRTLYIVAEDALTITLNGQQTQPFDTAIIQGSTLEVRVKMDQPVVVKIKKGVKTSGQMKYGATTLQADSNGVMTTEVDRGYYTVYIRTQDRQEVIAYVYREE